MHHEWEIRWGQVTTRFDQVAARLDQTVTLIEKLAAIAATHEHRLTSLEDKL